MLELNGMADTLIEIQHLGAQGDGAGRIGDQILFVPLALPGEHWRRGNDGQSFTCISPSADRVSPPCRHFTECGGCLAQHMPEAIYRAWKTALVGQALSQHGIMVEPAELISAAHSGRRRCVLSASKDRSGRLELGYHRARSHDLIAIEDCVVLARGIVKALPGLRELADLALPPGQSARLTVVKCEQGLDVDIGGMTVDNAPAHRAALATLARRLDLVRLSNEGDTLVM